MCGRDVEHLGPRGFNYFFYIVPEHFAAEQFRQIAPNTVAFVRQLQGQPQCEFVVFGISVAQYSVSRCVFDSGVAATSGPFYLAIT